MLQILTLSLVVLGAQPPVDVLAVSPKLEADALTVGPEYEIVLRVAIKDGWSASGAGVPAPLLQIDAPPAVKLSGKHLTSFKELNRTSSSKPHSSGCSRRKRNASSSRWSGRPAKASRSV